MSIRFSSMVFLLLLLLLALDSLDRAVSAQKTLQGNDCTSAGAYTLCQNPWGADTGVGSQTTILNSANGSSVSWETSYTWSNSPNNVKSYPNVYHNTAKGMQLQNIVSAPTSWQWTYQSASNDLRADVSYDIWFGVPQSGDVASGASSYEIMIWLSARGGVTGIGGVAAQNLRLGGHTWNLRHGPNGNWDVFSFITAEGDITDFDADLNDFFQYLVKEQGVAKTQYVQAIQAGTEPFTGSADLVTTNFAVDVSTEDHAPTRTSTSASSASSTKSTTRTATSQTATSAGPSPSNQASSTSASDSTSTPSGTDSGASAVQTNPSGTQRDGGAQCRLQATQSNRSRLRRRSRTGRSFLRSLFH